MKTALFDKPEELIFSNLEVLTIAVIVLLCVMIYLMLNIMLKIEERRAYIYDDHGVLQYYMPTEPQQFTPPVKQMARKTRRKYPAEYTGRF